MWCLLKKVLRYICSKQCNFYKPHKCLFKLWEKKISFQMQENFISSPTVIVHIYIWILKIMSNQWQFWIRTALVTWYSRNLEHSQAGFVIRICMLLSFTSYSVFLSVAFLPQLQKSLLLQLWNVRYMAKFTSLLIHWTFLDLLQEMYLCYRVTDILLFKWFS